MKKFEALRLVFESPEGITAKELSRKMDSAVSNIYGYLRELSEGGLVKKAGGGRYFVDSSNGKTGVTLDLLAMSPNRFHLYIAPSFGKLLAKFCGKLKLGNADLTSAEKRKVERLAIPARIVLRLSQYPSEYALKVNESLVIALLRFHGLSASFSPDDFNSLVESTGFAKPRQQKTAYSNPEVIAFCDELFDSNGDIAVLGKADGFVPDERLKPLLLTADRTNKEYRLFLDALDEHTRNAILDQWAKRYVYNTNKIEGNTMSERDVGEFLKTGKEPRNVSRREMFETSNMRNALDFLKLKEGKEIDEEFIRDLHFMVQKDIAESPGEYKNFYNYIRTTCPATTPPQHVRARLRLLLEWYARNKGTVHPFVLASIFHMQFEAIHPFPDGNGRVGRLLMNHVLRRHGFMPLTFLEQSKQNYYRALENMSIHQFLEHALALFIEEYKR